jgi:hypothetical protein
MLKLKVGGIYSDWSGKSYGPLKHNKDSQVFPFEFGGYCWTREGFYDPSNRTCIKTLVSIVFNPEDTKEDPIAHMFKEVPTKRKFVGGSVHGVGVYLNESKVRIVPRVNLLITPTDTRSVAAALLAAADELDNGVKE